MTRGVKLLPCMERSGGWLVLAGQVVERVNPDWLIDVLAREVGILKVLPEIVPERQVATHGSRNRDARFRRRTRTATGSFGMLATLSGHDRAPRTSHPALFDR